LPALKPETSRLLPDDRLGILEDKSVVVATHHLTETNLFHPDQKICTILFKTSKRGRTGGR